MKDDSVEAANIQVFDAGKHFARLEVRDATLDGNVPLRVAQACLPFLEGNEHGWQLVLEEALSFEKHLGRFRVVPTKSWENARRTLSAASPILQQQGLLTCNDAWKQLLQGPLHPRDLFARQWLLWTGLLVRTPANTVLRVAPNANRRARSFTFPQYFIKASDGWTPVVLPLQLHANEQHVRVDGEVATLSLHPAAIDLKDETLAEHQALGAAHVAFYDAHYFAAKKGEITRKYRKNSQKNVLCGEDEHTVFVVAAGSHRHRIVREALVASSGTFREAAVPPFIEFQAELDFSSRFDGLHVQHAFDRTTLQQRGAALEETWKAIYGEAFLREHRGAMWYLTKYFTPHLPGEPHFFVKPWAFVKTPPGWSCLLDGLSGEGYDLLRGVVETDWFHATPMVFSLHEQATIREGQPLLHVFPFPRALKRIQLSVQGRNDGTVDL